MRYADKDTSAVETKKNIVQFATFYSYIAIEKV